MARWRGGTIEVATRFVVASPKQKPLSKPEGSTQESVAPVFDDTGVGAQAQAHMRWSEIQNTPVDGRGLGPRGGAITTASARSVERPRVRRSSVLATSWMPSFLLNGSGSPAAAPGTAGRAAGASRR